jgi:hypothetical protein
LEYEDAKTLEVNEKFTLMKWGNAVVKSIKEQQDGSLYLEVKYFIIARPN